MFWRRLLLFSAAGCFGFIEAAVAQTPNVPSGTRFVMSHFKNDGGGGDERLYISISPDGLNWTALNNGDAIWQPDGWSGWGNVVRDPAIVYHDGFYWVAYTSGNYGRHAAFGLVKSRDLVNWTYVGQIGVPIPGATDQLTWSPTFFKDGDGSVHVFVNISPIGGTNYSPVGMKTYEMHPLNRDWTQWSAPQLVELPGGNSNELFVWKEGATYHGIYVDFSSGSAWIKVTSTSLTHGWSNPKSLGKASFEGALILKKTDDSGYRFYVEAGNANSPPSGTYLWADLDHNFDYVTGFTSFQSSIGMRNGKFCALHGSTSFADWQNANLGTVPPEERSPLADPDRDGFSNLLEAASGTSPSSNASNGVPHQISTGPDLLFRRAPWINVSLEAEGSTDLSSWSTEDVATQSVTLMTDGSEEVVVSHTGDASSGFLRLRATVQDTTSPQPLTVSSAPIQKTTRTISDREMRSIRQPILQRPLKPQLLRRPINLK